MNAALVDATGHSGISHGSDTTVGVAAALRAAKKTNKYKPICDRIHAVFKPAVMERHGHCDDGLCAFIKLISGDEDRDEAAEDYTFSASSRTTYVAQQIVFAGVMADARMVDRVFDCARFGIPLDRQRGRRDRREVV